MDQSDRTLEAKCKTEHNRPLNTEDKRWQKFAAGGTAAAFRAVFEYYYQPLYGYGVKLCRRPEVVKDGIHELFKNLWERRHDLTHIRSPKVYLFVSLRRTIRKAIKKQRRTTSEGTQRRGDDGMYFGREELIIRDETTVQQKKNLRQALNQLPDRQKEVVYLHYYHGLSYREITQILSIKRQSVRNHIYRAMQTLRSRLDIEIMKLVSSISVVCVVLSRLLL